MDDFCSLYSDFDNIKEEINGIVERQLLLNDYFNEKDNIINFIDYYTIDNDSKFDDFVSDSVKDDFSGVYDLVCKLLVFRDVDGF